MTTYLFLGGPAHGEYKDVKFTSTLFPEVHMPEKQKVNWVDPENVSPVMPTFQTVTYKKRTLYLSTGEHVDIMAESHLSDEQAWNRLGDFLAQKWVKQQFQKQEIQDWYKKDPFNFSMTPMELEKFAKELEKTASPQFLPHHTGTVIGSFKDAYNTVSDTNKAISELKKFIPNIEKVLPKHLQKCPVGQCSENGKDISAAGLAIHLNDGHRWSFEDIADYLDSLPIDLTVREKK